MHDLALSYESIYRRGVAVGGHRGGRAPPKFIFDNFVPPLGFFEEKKTSGQRSSALTNWGMKIPGLSEKID